jgi:hypothetical protein
LQAVALLLKAVKTSRIACGKRPMMGDNKYLGESKRKGKPDEWMIQGYNLI